MIWCPSNQLHTVDEIAEIVFDSKCCLFKVAFLKPCIEPATFNLTELSLGKFLAVNDNYFPWVTKI